MAVTEPGLGSRLALAHVPPSSHLLGRRYALLAFLWRLLGRTVVSECPATPALAFAVNVIACEIAFAMALFLRGCGPWSPPVPGGSRS